MKRFVGMGLLALGGCAATTAAPQGAMPAVQAEALYQQRFAALTTRTPGAGLAGYDTLAPVGGVAAWSPLPHRAGKVPAAATDYAARNNSSAFLVWHDGAIEAEQYFGGATADTLVVAKSLAKPIGVIAIGRAIARGYIGSLDEPAADFLHEWRGTPKAAITIRQILGMRSGLLPQGAAPDAGDILNRAYLHPYHDRILVQDYPLTDPPGSRYEYSNANGDLVAPLIERATHKSYADWLAREVFAPVGARGGQIWMDRPGGTPHSGCCILLPAESYLRLAILLAQDGEWEGHRLLPEGFVTAMRTPSPQNPHAGLGVYVGSPYVPRRGAANPAIAGGQTLHSAPYLADDLFLFDGNSNQVVYIVPSRKLVILRTGNTPPATPEWDNAMLPNLVMAAVGK